MIKAQSVGVEAHFDPRIFAKSRKIMTLLKRAATNIPHRNIMSSDCSRYDTKYYRTFSLMFIEKQPSPLSSR